MGNSTESEVLRKTRPRSVVVVAILQALQGLGLLGYGIYLIHSSGWTMVMKSRGLQYIPFPMFESISPGVVVIVLSATMVFLAFTLFFLQSWAWVASMTIQGLGLLTGLVAYLRHRPNYVGLLVGILLVMFLNQQEVQDAFRRKVGKLE